MARLFISAITATGRTVEVASEFRTWDGTGDRERQARLRDIGSKCGRRLIRRYLSGAGAPELWFTYHVYQKAPDWIGPLVCDALHIPYVVAEASYAPKQASGPWQVGHEQCRLGIGRADAVINLNREDIPCLRALTKPACRLVDLKPFMPMADIALAEKDRPRIAGVWGIPAQVPWLVCVAMMRPGDKLESFAQLADVLRSLLNESWHLIVVGDGNAKDRVEALFAPMARRVTMTGMLEPQFIYQILKSSDVYVWPAVNEAYGMALLEAQACGLPVVAAASGGIPQIVEHGQTGLLGAMNDTASLGRHIRMLIEQPRRRQRMAASAREKCRREHDISRAVTILDGVMGELTA